MRRFFIETIRKNFLNLKNTTEDSKRYIKVALQDKSLQNLKRNELSEQLDSFNNESDKILNLIKKQELSIERKTTYILFPKFLIRNFIVKRKINSMRKKFNNFVQEKSNLSFDEYKKCLNKQKSVW